MAINCLPFIFKISLCGLEFDFLIGDTYDIFKNFFFLLLIFLNKIEYFFFYFTPSFSPFDIFPSSSIFHANLNFHRVYFSLNFSHCLNFFFIIFKIFFSFLFFKGFLRSLVTIIIMTMMMVVIALYVNFHALTIVQTSTRIKENFLINIFFMDFRFFWR